MNQFAIKSGHPLYSFMSLYAFKKHRYLPAAVETKMFISRQRDKNVAENEQPETTKKKYWKKENAQSTFAVHFKRNSSPVVVER